MAPGRIFFLEFVYISPKFPSDRTLFLWKQRNIYTASLMSIDCWLMI